MTSPAERSEDSEQSPERKRAGQRDQNPERERAGLGRRGVTLSLALGALIGLTGCQGTIVGQWHLARAVPSREVFCIDDAEFRQDGSFSATTTIGGRTTREVGSYLYNGFKLRMRPQAGGERVYNAMRRWGALEVKHEESTVILEKGARPAPRDEADE